MKLMGEVTVQAFQCEPGMDIHVIADDGSKHKVNEGDWVLIDHATRNCDILTDAEFKKRCL